MFSFQHCLALILLSCENDNGPFATCYAQRRSCSRSVAVRSVWRVPFRNQFARFVSMFNLCYVFHHFWRACPPDHSVRSVWRPSSVHVIPLLGLPVRRLGGQGGPQIMERPRLLGILAAKVATERLKPPTGPPHEHLQSSKLVSSVAGCAMHMEWPDGIGRGSWVRENPKQERANYIPALPVLTGHDVRCPRAG